MYFPATMSIIGGLFYNSYIDIALTLVIISSAGAHVK